MSTTRQTKPIPPPTIPTPAMWERIVAVLLFLVLIVPKWPVAFILGGVLYFVLRKRNRMLAYHAILVALCQLLLYLGIQFFGLAINQLAKFGHVPLDDLATFIRGFILPANWALWSHLTLPVQLCFILAIAMFAANIAIAVYGAVLTARGRLVRLPLLSRISAGFVAGSTS